MNYKKAAALALSAALLLQTGCASSSGGKTMGSVKLKDDNFKELGRTYYSDGMIYCALSGTGVEFEFSGTECSVTVKGDPNSLDQSQSDNHARIAVYVDGERVIDDMVDEAEHTYEIINSDSEKSANIIIIKLSESPMSTFAISDITVNGTVSPADDSDRLIEFIGDSITCGYGVDDEDRNHHFSTKTEDVTKTYAYKTAEALGADWSMVSFSGYGIISGYSDGTRKVSEQTVPQYYGKLGYSWSKNGDFNPSDIEWNFKRKPDVVVINLGTNDASYCQHQPERCEEYKTEYIKFIKDIRKKNPDAVIICTLGIMGQDLYSYVEAAVSEYAKETDDSNVYCMMFDNQQETDGIAADWHPTEATHKKASDKLVEKIKEIMNW